MGMTSHAALPGPLPVPALELATGPLVSVTLPRRMAGAMDQYRAAPFRLQRPLLPVFSLLAMSAGVDGRAGGSTSASAIGGSGDVATTASRHDRDGPSSARAAHESGADPGDLHDLVVEHSDAVFRLAFSVVRDRALAEDVAQEALVKAWLALPTFRGDSSIRSWLLRITHNTAISTLRRRRAVVIDPHDLPERQTRVDRSVEARVQSHVVMDEFRRGARHARRTVSVESSCSENSKV